MGKTRLPISPKILKRSKIGLRGGKKNTFMDTKSWCFKVKLKSIFFGQISVE